jgi:hypothetical protein
MATRIRRVFTVTSRPVSGTVNPTHPWNIQIAPDGGSGQENSMAGIEMQPDNHDEIGDALEWMRLTYALDYPAKSDSWERPEDYPQSWAVRAYIDADTLEPDYDTYEADAQGRVTVAEAHVYVIPDSKPSSTP